jgi:hypothetical protein
VAGTIRVKSSIPKISAFRSPEGEAELVPGLKAEIVPNANHLAEYTAPDVVNEKVPAFFAD